MRSAPARGVEFRPVFLAILVILLARRSRIAWGLLVLIDGIPTLLMLASVLGT